MKTFKKKFRSTLIDETRIFIPKAIENLPIVIETKAQAFSTPVTPFGTLAPAELCVISASRTYICYMVYVSESIFRT